MTINMMDGGGKQVQKAAGARFDRTRPRTAN